MTVYEELVARGLIAQVTNEKEIKETLMKKMPVYLRNAMQMGDKLINL